MKKIEIQLGNKHTLVAELCEYGGEIPPEFAVYIQDEMGAILQDIALIREKAKEGFVVDNVDVGAEVLVWADKTNEDYTHQFLIDECNYEDE